MENKSLAQELLQEGNGVLRLAPAWVPRSFCRPGRRLKLHPDDYYALGLERGGIDERWFASTTHAENGPETPADEGLSYVVSADGSKKMLLKDMVELLQDQIIGTHLWNKYGRWPAYSKFFDNQGPLPHHIHHRNEHAALTGQLGKPEMYFFPAQMNNYRAERAETYFGLNPGTTKEDLKKSTLETLEFTPIGQVQAFLRSRNHWLFRQELMTRDFGTNQGLKSADILCVFQGFQTAELGQKIRQQPKVI